MILLKPFDIEWIQIWYIGRVTDTKSETHSHPKFNYVKNNNNTNIYVFCNKYRHINRRIV